MEVGEGHGALDRKSALHVSVYVVDRRSCVNGLLKCDIKMSGDGISRNLSAELHIVQRQVYDCYTAINNNKNSSGDKIANVNFLTTISHTRRPTSKYRKRDKPTSLNKLDDR